MSKSAYTELIFERNEALSEILPSLLGEIGFEMFEENEREIKDIEAQNWNAAWEENYPNIYIDTFCQILPSFRQPEAGFTHTVIIDPKMSFGTGHHATTRMVMKLMQGVEMQNKTVLDMGSGTGVLGILASKLGAKEILGIDIDAWAYENAQENCRLNSVTNMELIEGDATKMPKKTFDIILANINRNILIADSAHYDAVLANGGTLIVSGFYDFDANMIEAHYIGMKYRLVETLKDGGWNAMKFEKS